MSEGSKIDEFEILQTIVSSLKALDRETQIRLLETTITFLGIKGDSLRKATVVANATGATETPGGPFSDRPNISPKEFLLDKNPRSDVERVACLAYYLAHYRNVREFKTLDISKLNTGKRAR